MRKLFVLFLLVALVPFTVGCNGLWDFDDDSDPALVKAAAASVKPVVTVSSSVVSASLRAKFDAWSIPMNIGGKDYFPVDVQPSGTNYVLTYPEIDVTNLFTGDATSATVPATINIGGVSVNVSFSASKLSTSSTQATTQKSITIEVTADNKVKVTVDSTAVESTTTVDTNAQRIVSVKFGTVGVSANEATPTTVNTITPEFVVTLNKALTDAEAAALTWSVKATNLTTGIVVNMDQATQLLEATANTDKTAYTLKVKGSTEKFLRTGHSYKVEFVASSVTFADADKPATRYIKVVTQ